MTDQCDSKVLRIFIYPQCLLCLMYLVYDCEFDALSIDLLLKFSGCNLVVDKVLEFFAALGFL